jgi:competence protein ComEC
LSGLLVIGFIAVTGLSPSMTRAGLVAGLALASWYYGRKFHPVTLLLFAAAVTGLADPSYVWGNLGWQLSFAAFAGVMVLAPLGQAYFYGDAKPGWVRQVLGETISAQIATAPLILYSFGQISNVAVIANLLVLPLVPLAMALTFAAGIAGLVLPMATAIVALPAQWLLDYMVFVTMQTAGVSWAQTEYELPLWGMLASFAAIIAACWWMWRATGLKLRQQNIIE